MRLQARLERLRAPGIHSVQGVTLNGRRFGTDGYRRARRRVNRHRGVAANHTYLVRLAPSSAPLLTIHGPSAAGSQFNRRAEQHGP